jgi:hypothetical protein
MRQTMDLGAGTHVTKCEALAKEAHGTVLGEEEGERECIFPAPVEK